jgi:general secretion pathway protein A
MYEQYFGLKAEPFSVAPDPRFLYMSDRHREALTHLTHGLRHAGSFVLLTGEIGAGKTTVWRAFLEQLPSHFDVAYVVNPKLGVNALLTRIREDLRVELNEGEDALSDAIDAIHGHLLLAHSQGRRTLIVVDEAQALSVDVMEQLRLLTNLVITAERKLVQVLLIGQPELRTMLEQPALEPLAQRVVARYHLTPLAEAETARYIAHRLAIAGLTGESPFEPAAVRQIHRLCGGVPRRINVLCDRALVDACTRRLPRVDVATIERAAGQVFGRRPAPPSPPAVAPAQAAPPPWPRWPRWLLAGTALTVAVGAGVALAPTLAPLAATLFTLKASTGGPRSAAVAPMAPVAPTATAAPIPTDATPPPAVTQAAPVSGLDTPPAPLLTSAIAPPATPPAPASALDALFARGSADEGAAWRGLAALWGVSLPPGDACEVAVSQGLHCHRTRGGLGPIRQLGRPGIVKLADEHGHSAQVLLTGLSDDSATLRIGGVEQTVPLAQLARAWRGEFATFWRAPAGYRAGELASGGGPLATWLRERLAAIDAGSATTSAEQPLSSRIFAFQLAHGLEPDGLAGPLTMMQLNRASGVDEPRLVTRR